jgi:biopolymer transport protein ExbD
MALDSELAIEEDSAALNTTINTTPLVDVMLVLLIIFLVTIPVIVKVIPVELPNYRNIVTVTKPENIVIAVDKDENIFFNSEQPPIDPVTLRYRLVNALYAAQKAHKTFPEVHIRADKSVRFEAVGRVILSCQQAGIQKVGFLTEPHTEDTPAPD